MATKVFISCGQATDREIETAKKIKEWLENKEIGFEKAYVAIREQEMQDLNSAIINNLADSDYFLFIDFKRETINGGNLFKKVVNWLLGKKSYRGSLFAHQELALAYYLGFEDVIFLHQEGVISEGFLKSIQGNSIPFRGYDEILEIVKEQVGKRWDKNYSRHLVVGDITKSEGSYGDHSSDGQKRQQIWHCRIDNRRKREAAQNVVARLKEIRDEKGEVKSSPDKQALKWAGAYTSYSYVIPPQSDGTFDLFCTFPYKLTEIYLHSLLDVKPREPIIRKAGEFYLIYQISAINFPRLEFSVKLNSGKIPLEVNIVKSSDGSGISLIM